MKRNHSSLIVLITFLFLPMLINGCGQFSNSVPTATAYPTHTPLPTYTPLPTSLPARWDVKVLSVITLQDFDGATPKSDESRWIIITIEYTYQGLGSVAFSPESLILMNITTDAPSKYYGWSNPTLRYQPENISTSISFDKKASMIDISPGTTRVDRFGWIYPKELTNFRLFFPETEAIDITVE